MVIAKLAVTLRTMSAIASPSEIFLFICFHVPSCLESIRRRDEIQGIEPVDYAVFDLHDLEMDMRTGDITGVSDIGDDLAFFNILPRRGDYLRAVAVVCSVYVLLFCQYR